MKAIKISMPIIACAAALALCLSGCAQTKYYDVKKVLSLDSPSIVNLLEQSGFDYNERDESLFGTTATFKEWTAPKDEILGDYKMTKISFRKTKAEMEHSDAKIRSMDIDLIGGSTISDEIAPVIADKIMEKCGLSGSSYDEGKNLVDEWFREGICTINGEDARWQIFVVNGSDVNYIALDIDFDNLGLISDYL